MDHDVKLFNIECKGQRRELKEKSACNFIRHRTEPWQNKIYKLCYMYNENKASPLTYCLTAFTSSLCGSTVIKSGWSSAFSCFVFLSDKKR